MKTTEILCNRQLSVSVLFMTIFMLLTSIGHAQKSKEVSLSVYPGFTLINFEKALGYSSDNLENWNQFHLSAAVRGFLLSEKPIQFGAEVAWNKLYYAYYVIPYGPSPVYREFNVTTFSMMLLGRHFINKFFFVGGAGLHFFNSGVSAGICLESGYMINAGESIKIPVSIRIDPIFASGTPVPISLGAGLTFAIK
jgi:hypothetical protein